MQDSFSYSTEQILLIIVSGIMIGVALALLNKLIRSSSQWLTENSTKIGLLLFGLSFFVAFVIISGIDWMIIFNWLLVVIFIGLGLFLFIKSRKEDEPKKKRK